MKLAELKEHTYECWERLSTYRMALVQPEHFKPEVRTFGDLRRKTTWEKACASFKASNIYASNLDNRELITIYFQYTPDEWDWELREQILDQFLVLPEGLNCVINGLEQIFNYPSDQEERDAAYGVLELVQRQCAGAGHSIGPLGKRKLTHTT